MNPLILLFNSNLLIKPLFIWIWGEKRLFTLYFTSGYSGSCIRVYSIQRYIEKELVSDIFLEANKSFYFLYGYVLFVGVK